VVIVVEGTTIGGTSDDNGDYKAAIDDFNKSIKLKNDYALAYNNRGAAKFKLKDYKGAIEDYDKAILFNPKYGHAYLNRGMAKELVRDTQGACQDWEKAAGMGIEQARSYTGDCE